jgi:hypothetical protein
VASFCDRVVDPRTVLIGEVGLGGQVRLVSQMELRLKEAAKLGFKLFPSLKSLMRLLLQFPQSDRAIFLLCLKRKIKQQFKILCHNYLQS